eukprot:SAG31_NODE_2051_length_6559_cov_370.073684_2_plen_37_part_00
MEAQPMAVGTLEIGYIENKFGGTIFIRLIVIALLKF